MAGSPPPNNDYPQQGYPQHPHPQHPPQPQPYSQSGSGSHPGAPYGVHPGTGIPYSDKQRQTAGFLQLAGLLGFGGIGRMYAGQVGLGIAQLAVGWVTCGLGLWWSIIEGILYLVDSDTGKFTDAEGRPLRPN
jgi:TM2 domain-containing membrane protein YozV